MQRTSLGYDITTCPPGMPPNSTGTTCTCPDGLAFNPEKMSCEPKKTNYVMYIALAVAAIFLLKGD